MRSARAALLWAYLLHVAWFATMCTLAGLQWHQYGIEASVLLTLITVPPVLFHTVRVHHLCRRIDPAAPTVGWVPVLITTIALSPFEAGLVLPAKNLLAASRLLRAHRISGTAPPTAEAAQGKKPCTQGAEPGAPGSEGRTRDQ